MKQRRERCDICPVSSVKKVFSVSLSPVLAYLDEGVPANPHLNLGNIPDLF